MELTEREKRLMNWARDLSAGNSRRMRFELGFTIILFACLAMERAHSVLSQASPPRWQAVVLVAFSFLLGMYAMGIYATLRQLRFANVIRFLTEEQRSKRPEQGE